MARRRLLPLALALNPFLLGTPSHAQTSSVDQLDIAFMPRAMTVKLLNEGDKYVAIDLKHIPQGGECRMDEGAIVVRSGNGEPGFARMRYLGAQMSSGGCPFLTIFDLPDEDYRKARADFVQKEEEAKAKIEELRKAIGDKWDEIVGNKS